jgi:hypothetical protein
VIFKARHAFLDHQRPLIAARDICPTFPGCQTLLLLRLTCIPRNLAERYEQAHDACHQRRNHSIFHGA